MLQNLFSVLTFVATVIVAMPAKASGPAVSAKEFSLYMDWRDGRDDERLAKLDTAAKMKKIAVRLGVKTAELQAAISKVEPVVGSLASDTEKAIREALNSTPLKGRVLDIKIDAAAAHAVALVKWRCGDKRDYEKELSYVGWAVGDGGSIIGTLGAWCVNEVDTKLLSAKAAGTALARIDKGAIERFASSRYIRLFDDVKRGPHK